MHQQFAPMDYAGLAQMQQNPNPTHNPYPNHNFDPLPSSSYPTEPTTGYPNQDPYHPAYYTGSTDPHGAMLQPRLLGMPPPVTSMVLYAQNLAAFQSVDAVPAAAAAYYPESNASWETAYGQLGVIPQATLRGVTLPNPANQLQLHKNKNWKKIPMKTKIVQSAWCEVCKIGCNSKDVLDNHKLGKKHKNNLEKLRGPTNTTHAPAITYASVSTSSIGIPIIGPLENPGKEAKKKKAAAVEDLGTKLRKVLDGGAAAEAVRTCIYCNVVCNSETVFNYHIAGQKHAAMVKKHGVLARIGSMV